MSQGLATYTIHFAGEIEVQATNEEEAIDRAWVEHAVHADDIQLISVQRD